MRNECLNLINTEIEVKVEDKTLAENLKVWKKDRNITNSNYLVFVGNVLEELLEPLYDKPEIKAIQQDMLDRYFWKSTEIIDKINKLLIVDTIKDIKVFCVNEIELMGYDDLKTDNEVFKHINCRKQDPIQYLEWKEKGAFGKWKKWAEQPEHEIYQPDYESCKL